MCASSQERPREPHEAFAGIGPRAGSVAGGDRHEIGVQTVLHDVTGVKFVGVAFLAEDHRGFQRTRAAGGAMSNEVDVGKLLRIALEEGGGCGAASFEDSRLRSGEIFPDLLHFLGSVRKRGKQRVGGLAIADEEKAFAFGRRLSGGGG